MRLLCITSHPHLKASKGKIGVQTSKIEGLNKSLTKQEKRGEIHSLGDATYQNLCSLGELTYLVRDSCLVFMHNRN